MSVYKLPRATKDEQIMALAKQVEDYARRESDKLADLRAALAAERQRAEKADATIEDCENSYAQLGRDYDALETDHNVLQGQLGDAEAERDRLKEALAVAKDALKPFAAKADWYERDDRPPHRTADEWHVLLHLSDCRIARAALAACEQGGKEPSP